MPPGFRVSGMMVIPRDPFYDVVIVGGGAAGLSAAQMLGGGRRSVAVAIAATGDVRQGFRITLDDGTQLRGRRLLVAGAATSPCSSMTAPSRRDGPRATSRT